MKKEILSEELLRMKRLAGIISESQYNENIVQKVGGLFKKKAPANQNSTTTPDATAGQQVKANLEKEIKKLMFDIKYEEEKIQDESSEAGMLRAQLAGHGAPEDEADRKFKAINIRKEKLAQLKNELSKKQEELKNLQ